MNDNRNADIHYSARSRDGFPYRIRPLRPDDAGRERDFINGLSPNTRYQRFMHQLREAGDALIERLVNVDYRRNMALAAVIDTDGAERIIGVARYSADNDQECEFAVVVADAWQCRGVGTTLTPLLFDCAARAGFKTIYGTVLADNQRMIELSRWMGLTVDAPRHGETTVRAWRNLAVAPRQSGWPAWAVAATAIVDPGALLLLIAANATPVLVARLLGKRGSTRIDAAFPHHMRPVFGAHKTWRGIIVGALACALLGALLPCGIVVALWFGLLALAGDLASSFVKRRMQWPSGHPAPLLDQLPESLLPLIVFGGNLGMSGASIIGTAAVFTLLDMATAGWREAPKPKAL